MRRLGRTAARAFLLVPWLCLGGTASRADPAPPGLDYLLQRAALEISCGRPAAAAAVLRRLPPAPRDGEARRFELALLLRAEAQVLAREPGAAEPLLDSLAAHGSDFVRAQAATHRLGIAAVSPDSTARGRALQWQAEARRLGRGGRDAAALGELLAARMLQDDATASGQALDAARQGPARAAAALLQADAALRRGDVRAAGERFAVLADASDTRAGGGWLHAWALLGRAQSSAQGGRADDAVAILHGITAPEPLRRYAQLVEAEIALAGAGPDQAALSLRALDLSLCSPEVASEAMLLELQAELDAGRFAAAESLGDVLERRLPRLFAPDAAAGLSRTLQFDLDAWHAARTRATLQELSEAGVLHRFPDPSCLSGLDAVLVLQPDAERDSSAARLELSHLVFHESEIDSAAAAARGAWRRAGDGRAAAHAAALRASMARARWDERRALLGRGAAALDSCAAALAALEAGVSRLGAGLATHAAHLDALESAWRAALGRRLAALGTACAELHRATTRLEARYPHDRSIRDVEITARARAGAAGEQAWIAAAESLQVRATALYAKRLHDILHGGEMPLARAQLDSLQAEARALRDRAGRLRAALQGADGLEREAFASADSERLRAESTAASTQQEAERMQAIASRALAAARRQRLAAYAEAAEDGGATAAFQGALAPDGADSLRLARLEHAAAKLDRWVTRHPDAARADEMLYRLGETHLQRATLQYRADLAAFLARGGKADAAPVPVESYAAALGCYQRLLQRYPASPRGLDAEYQVGFLLAEMGSAEASMAHLRHFLAQVDAGDPRHARAALRLGDDALQLGQEPQALEAYRLACTARDPETRQLALFKCGWCAFDLERHEEARTALHALLDQARDAAADSTFRAPDLQPEALELLALAFTADHDARQTAAVLDAWNRPPYEFALLRRQAQLFTARAQYDAAIQSYETLLDRHPLRPEIAACADELLRLIELRQGAAPAHERAAQLAPRFAPGSAWAQHASQPGTGPEPRPLWQSRLVQEDAAAQTADSLGAALARPDVAAARMAQHLRAAAVFEHRRAQSDTTGARASLQRAEALYQQTLKQFPGAADEATTWLYLGEARYALGEYEAAADAYGSCGAHTGADSTLRRRAAGQELAALDAASAARPQAALDRYDRSARLYAKRYPTDPRGVDAIERVGELAFRSARYEQAEGAYLQVAARTPDAARGAQALKMAGDTHWKRERYDAAAALYDSALARDRSARGDTLSKALRVLVPAALYRAAEQHESSGRREPAARGFESLAARHATFQYADRALYRAARLRAASGDSATAGADYQRLVDGWPASELHADALLELGRCQQSQGARLAAARTFRRLATQHPAHPQANAARLRAGELFQASGNPAAADSEYAQLLRQLQPGGAAPAQDATLAADLWMRRARLARSPSAAAALYEHALAGGAALPAAARAEAEFQIAEASRDRYEKLPLREPLVTSLRQKKAALETLLLRYSKSAETRIEPWHAASCLRIGSALADLSQALRKSPAPADLQGEDLLTYQEAIGAQCQKLEDRAVAAWSRGLGAARGAQYRDAWTVQLEKRLYPFLAERVPTRPEPMFVLVQP